MKKFSNYIIEKLQISRNKPVRDFDFNRLQNTELVFDYYEQDIGLKYFKITDNADNLVCYVETIDDPYGGSDVLIVLVNNDDYGILLEKYNLEEDEDLGWTRAPEELTEIVKKLFHTQLDICIGPVGLWYDSRYNYKGKKYLEFVDKLYNDLER